MVALGTDHHAWLAAPVLGRWVPALHACTGLLVVVAVACVALLPLTRRVLVVVLASCIGLGLVLGTNDARTWHACLQSAGIAHADARSMVDLTATVLSAPEPTRRADPVMEPMAAERRAVRLVLGAITDPSGAAWPACATLQARIAVGHTDLAIGDRIKVKGWIAPMRPPGNPGGYDMSRWARSRFVIGSMFIESMDLVTRVGHEARPVECWKRSMVLRLQSIVATMAPEHAALCVAMTLGPTGPPMDDIASDCQVTGMTHVLALSGFNVGLLLAIAGRIMVLTPCRGMVRALVLAGCAALFMVSASAGISADRAAIAAMMASVLAGQARGFKPWHAASAVAVVVVVGAPSALLDIGFQLSVVVAAALAAWAGRAPSFVGGWIDRSVAPGSNHGSVHTHAIVLVKAGLTAVLVGMTACLASAPIVMHHFGSITPLVVPGSIVAAPLSAVIITLCTVALIMDGPLCTLSPWLVVPAEWCAAVFAWLVDHLAAWPRAAWTVEPIHGWVCVGSLVCIVMAMRRGRGQRTRTSLHPVWLLPPVAALAWWAWPTRFDLRVTMLDVGNGSAWVVEHGDTAVLVDGGSLDVPDVGARTIVPALRSLGIQRLSAISLSHADLDHLNGLPAVLARMPTGCVVTTPCLIEGACPGTPSGFVLAAAARAGCPVFGLEAGDGLGVRHGAWIALHPHHGVAPFPRNESSLVWWVTTTRASLLLTGDIEEDGAGRIRDVLRGHGQDVRPLLMELPHHGSFRPGVASLIEQLHPEWIGQSTGPARLARDRWAWIDGSTTRSVTARDGAVRVTVIDGTIHIERWDQGWIAGGSR